MKEIIKVGVTAKKAQLDQCKADVLCIGMFSDTGKLDKITKQLDDKLRGAIENVIKLGDFKGKELSSVVIYTNGKIAAERLMLVGLGDRKKATLDTLRKAASHASNKAVAVKAGTMASALHQAFGKKFDQTKCGQVIAEGIYFGAYRYDEFMTNSDENGRSKSLKVEIVDFDAPTVRKLEKGSAAGSVIGQAQNLARTLANRPANIVYPAKLAEEAKKIVSSVAGLSCTIFDEKQLKQKKMGGIVAVGQGSVHPPRMIILKYTPKTKKKSGTVCFVGKAITFDSGGISIKPSANMGEMKMDMTGGAVVLGTMKAIAELKLPVSVCGIICSAENAPDGKSFRPGDVITTYSGKTVEILNTDAEGRMVLCDGIHYAKEKKCQLIEGAGLVIDSDLVLENLLDDDFHLCHVLGVVDKRPGALDKFSETFLYKCGEFESSANLIDNFGTFKCLYHFFSCLSFSIICVTSFTACSRSSLITMLS